MSEGKSRFKVDALTVGTKILGITKLSGEYSYLDSRRINELKTRFKGAVVARDTNGKREAVRVESLEPGNAITAIGRLPPGLGFEAIDATMKEYLATHGFEEFEGILAAPVAEAPTEAAPGPGAIGAAPAAPGAAAAPTPAGNVPVTQEIPRFKSMGGLHHQKRVAEARFFLEQVEKAENSRMQSSNAIHEMFQQGRADRQATKPAMEMVEHILRMDLSKAMTAISGLMVSDQTYAHCVDMAVIFQEGANGILKATGKPANEKVARSTLAAGFMHDIGKSKIPVDVLDSTARFDLDSKEMQLMRSHVEISAQILTDAGMDDSMINVAHYHHVKKDTSLPSSYPHVSYNDVAAMTRLAAIVDVYQALTGKRSYKKNWVPAKAVEYLENLKGTEFDEVMLANFLKVIGRYPVGSLVRLSTGDLGFVTKVEDQPPDQPVVVLVENAVGERLAKNPLVDLTAEQDLSITEALDHYEYYNESLHQTFEIFKSLSVI